MNITIFVKSLNSKQLVGIYNLAAPEDKQIKKFVDRPTAEARVIKVVGGSPDYITFHQKYSQLVKPLGIELPEIEAPKPAPMEDTPEMAKAKKILEQDRKRRDAGANAVEPAAAPAAPKPARKSAPSTGEAKKQNTPPHLNVRCASCGYYAKTTPAMMKIARLKCPVDAKHGNLLTAEERGEKRGR